MPMSQPQTITRAEKPSATAMGTRMMSGMTKMTSNQNAGSEKTALFMAVP